MSVYDRTAHDVEGDFKVWASKAPLVADYLGLEEVPERAGPPEGDGRR